jgi:hypothetical protein
MPGGPTRPQIFVSIVAYQDPLLKWTLDQCWSSAAHPERLRFGIVEQAVTSLRSTGASGAWSDQASYALLHPRDARGPCWARAIAFSFWRGERYLLQIDSHMLFDRGWDELLIDEVERWQRRTGNARVLVSTYPLGFDWNGGEPIAPPRADGPIILRPLKDKPMEAEHPVLGFEGIPTPGDQPVAGCHVGAGCLFGTGEVVEQVPYDPWLYFHGEEQNFAIRAWTRGYDIVHPVHMPIYHLYRAPDHKDVVHWTPSEDEGRKLRWWELESQSRERMVRLLYRRDLSGAYGLGAQRSLEDFAQFSGIDYIRRSIGPGGAPPRSFHTQRYGMRLSIKLPRFGPEAAR